MKWSLNFRGAASYIGWVIREKREGRKREREREIEKVCDVLRWRSRERRIRGLEG